MQRHLFLCGLPDSGAPLFKKVLGGRLAEAGGYYTEPVACDGGRAIELIPAAALAGVEGFERSRFLDLTVSPPVRDNEVFRHTAAELLRQSEYYHFSVVCGLGGFELVIPEYRAELGNFLSSRLPCAGTIITEAHAGELRALLGLGERYSALYRQLRIALENAADALTVDVCSVGADAAEDVLRRWAAEYLS